MTFYNIQFEVAGGIEQYHRNLSAALEQLGYRVIDCSLGDWKSQLRTGQIDNQGITIFHDPNHAEEASEFRHLNVNVWLFIHGDYDFYLNAAIRHHIWIRQIFCVNNHSLRVLQNLHRIQNATYLPPCLPALSNFQAIRSKKLELVFVGRIERNKGAHLLQHISNLLVKNSVAHSLTIIYGTSFVDKEILREIQNWTNKVDFVSLFPDLSHESTLQHIAKSHALLLPSKKEGFPLCVAEAMAMGTIPIVSRYSPGVQSQLPIEYQEFITNFHLNAELVQLIQKAFKASPEFREIGQLFVLEQNSFETVNTAVQLAIRRGRKIPSKLIINNAITLALWKNRFHKLMKYLHFPL